MSKILVLYYSSYGHLAKMADAMAEGARSAGAQVDVRRVPETAPFEVAQAHAFVSLCFSPFEVAQFSSFTRTSVVNFALMSACVPQFAGLLSNTPRIELIAQLFEYR